MADDGNDYDNGENGIDEAITAEAAGDMTWREYKRLLFYQQRETRRAIDKLTARVDRMGEQLHDRITKLGDEHNTKLGAHKTETQDKIARQNTEIALLQLKSGIWGTLAAILVAGAASFFGIKPGGH